MRKDLFNEKAQPAKWVSEGFNPGMFRLQIGFSHVAFVCQVQFCLDFHNCPHPRMQKTFLQLGLCAPDSCASRRMPSRRSHDDSLPIEA